jgi:hypothetical protein
MLAQDACCAAVSMFAAGDCRAVSSEAESVSVSDVGGGGACNGSGWPVIRGKRLLL